MNGIPARSLRSRSVIVSVAVSMGILLLSPVIAAVIDDDGRMTEEEYAKAKGQPLEEIQARFAATGVLRCGSLYASAQLTGNNDTLTSVGHILMELNCKKMSSAPSCTFSIRVGHREQASQISGIVGTGIKCPGANKIKNDWVVLKLKQPIFGVKPYKLPYPDEVVNERDSLLAVAATADDFGKKKSIEDCEAKQPYFEDGEQTVFASNCDSSSGASGGSTLRERKRYDVLVGIFSSTDEKKEQLARALRRGYPNRGSYAENKWATYHVPLTGKFLEAVQRSVGGRNYYND